MRTEEKTGICVAAPTKKEISGIATILDHLVDRAKENIAFAIKPPVGDLRIITRRRLDYTERLSLERHANRANIPVTFEEAHI